MVFLGIVANIIWGFVFCGFICLGFLGINSLVGYGGFADREKASIYECGFEPAGPTRVSFSLRFFLIAVIFLVFDLEIVLLFPFVLGMSSGYDWLLTVRTWVFLFILSAGLAHEHNEGSLDWKD